MNSIRKKKLELNPRILFWIKALFSASTINAVATLFYLHRGLELSELFYLAITFALVALLFEIPSSYMADKWGRKNTLLFGGFCIVFHKIFLLFSHSLGMFIFSAILMSFYFAAFSGTDEALLYDTAKELGKKKESLRILGKYYSAQRLFKIFTPLLGAFIAQGLTETQFLAVISIDVVLYSVGLILIFFLIEPNHHEDVEKMEAGIIKDVFTLLKGSRFLRNVIFNRTLIFIASFILWRMQQKYFLDAGITVIGLGIGWSIYQLFGFMGKKYIFRFFPGLEVSQRLMILNSGFLLSLIALVFFVFTPGIVSVYIVFGMYLLMSYCELMRWPLFADLVNTQSRSFNRATTLSLSNFVKSIFDVPLLLLASYLISIQITYVFGLSLAIACVAMIFFSLHKRQAS